MSEQMAPEREAEIRVKLEREANAHGSVHFVPPKAGMVRDLLGEIDRLRARVQQLEGAAIEARGALGALCYDLEDPGSNAFGALHLLSQATLAVAAAHDDSLQALARRDADKLDAAAEDIVTACPDHGDAEEAWMDCHCVAAEELNRQASSLRKGGVS